jgi:aryl-alcohol dehydrogenase-like predicted oxidoreductase
MQTNPLGRTGLVVSRLGLGLAALGRPGYINLGHADDLNHQHDHALLRQRAHEVLDAALAGGVSYFDAARSYGDAEAFLASWLSARALSPERVVIGSKWGYTYTAGWKVQAEKHEIKEHSLAVLARQAAESRGLLGGFLRLYQIHSANLESGVLDDQAVLHRLVDLRREYGWRIGLSLSGPQQAATLRKALTLRNNGEPVFDCVQATWNLLERSAGTALAEAHDAGLGVIIKEALANGRLTARNEDPAFRRQRQILEHSAQRLGTTLDALALAGVLARPWVDVVLSGAATVPHLHSNRSSLQVAWDARAEADLADLLEEPEVYWRIRSGLAWN